MGRQRDIYRQIQELTEENERLVGENKALREENRKLRTENAKLLSRVESLESTLEQRINQAVEAAVSKATAPLYAIIAEKDKEILRLKSQLAKDSSNSSKPPSSNGFKKIPNNRESSGRKQGGQPGHTGTRFNIPENLDELVSAGKAEHNVINDVAPGEPYVSDWTVDIKIVVVFTEHRRPAGKPPRIEYGSWLKSLAVYLCVIGLLSYERLSCFFQEITHHIFHISKATLEASIHGAAERIEMDEYVEDLLDGNVINTDETPIKTSERPADDGTPETASHTTYNAYIRTYSNSKTTVLTAHPHKTEESVVADNILTRFHGIIAQDHESKFYNFGYSHATCGAHLTRDLKGLSQLQLLSWAEEVRQFFLEMNRYKNEDILKSASACDSEQLSKFEAQYDALLQKGKCQLDSMTVKSFGYDELRRMVNRLDKHKDNYLLFVRNYDAPFTNNQAERDLRHCKTKQKVSGCFRSWQGVLDYCKIRSFTDTLHKRHVHLIPALAALFG
jgi:regulator of replication initiation timing